MADWSDFELHFGPPRRGTGGVSDRDYAIRTVLAEAGDQGDVGLAAVAHVINNRLKSGNFGSSIKEIVTKPYQFEPWLYAGKGEGNDPLRFAPDSPDYQKAAAIVDGVLTGKIPDPTKGATHFYSPAGQAAAKDGRKLVPNWATPKSHLATIGGHEFFAPGGAAPKGDALAYAAPDWITAAEDEISGKGATKPEWIPPEESAEPQYPEPLPPPIKPTRWNAAASFGQGMTLGKLPQAVAGINAGYDYLTGQAPGGFEEDYSRRLERLEEQKNIYQRQNPLAHAFAEGAGALVTSVPAIEGIAAPALGAAFTRAGAAPVARFFGGRAGEGMGGMGGAALRRASYGGQGAAQGAAQGVLTQGLAPDDTTLPEQVGVGAGIGAGVASVVNPLVSRLAAPLTAEIAPALRKLALTAHDKYGIPLRVGQVAAEREIQDLDKNIVDASLNNEQAQTLMREIGKRIGANSETLTKDVVEDAMRQTGKRMEKIASSTTLVPNQAYVNRLHDITLAAQNNIVDDSTRNAVVKVLMKVAAETVRPGGVPGKIYQNLTQKGGLVDLNLTSSSNPVLRKFGGDIKNALFELFEINDPKLAKEWSALRQQYKNAITILPLAEKSPSGVINPKLLLSRVNSKKVGGDMRELAEIGQYITPTTAQGAGKQTAREGLLTRENLVAGGVGALGIGEAWPLLSRLLDYANVSPGMAAIPLAAIGGGQYVGNKLLGKAMSSPKVSKAVLRRRVPNFVQPAENVLVRGAVTPMLQVGAGKGK